MRVNLFVLALILMLIVVACARGERPASVPPDVVKSWSMIIGKWNVEGRVRNVIVSGTASFEWVAGKHCYIGQQIWHTSAEEGPVHLAQIGGWDASTNETVEQGFSSSGDAATVRYSATAVIAGGGAEMGKVEGTTVPDRRWSGVVERKWTGPDEFTLTSRVKGDVVHSLKYVRATNENRPDK